MQVEQLKEKQKAELAAIEGMQTQVHMGTTVYAHGQHTCPNCFVIMQTAVWAKRWCGLVDA